MGVDLDVFSYSAVLFGKFQFDADIAVFVHLDLLYKFNQNIPGQFVDVFMLSESC